MSLASEGAQANLFSSNRYSSRAFRLRRRLGIHRAGGFNAHEERCARRRLRCALGRSEICRVNVQDREPAGVRGRRGPCECRDCRRCERCVSGVDGVKVDTSNRRDCGHDRARTKGSQSFERALGGDRLHANEGERNCTRITRQGCDPARVVLSIDFDAMHRTTQQRSALGAKHDYMTAVANRSTGEWSGFQQVSGTHERQGRSSDTIGNVSSIQKVVTRKHKGDDDSAWKYWATRPVAERLAMVEELRAEYHGWIHEPESRLPRVCRIIRRP